jgi:glycosyltransferase involved in cell wall biosynthesis
MMLGRFARTARRERPDILLPYTAFPNVICGLSWRFAGAKVCVWNQLDAGLGLESPAVPWAVRNTPLFLSNSYVGAEFLAQTFRIAPQRIRVARNPVRLQPPRDDRGTWRARIGADDSCLIACMVANLHRQKDHTTLLQAWRLACDRLSGSGRRAVLVLAGRLDAADPVRQLVEDFRLTASVRFLGEVDDVAGLLTAADLGVFSSRSEGCPNAVLESMGAALPLVATDCPGVREAVGDQGAAWLAPAGDAEGLAERIVRLAGDPALRAQLGAANARRIQAEFTLERLSAEVESLLTSALATRSWPNA